MQRARPRGLWGLLWMLALQPGAFFRSLPPLADNRQWLWAGLLILALTGIGAVRREELIKGGGNAAVNTSGPPPGLTEPGASVPGAGPAVISGGGGGGIIISGGPPPSGGGPPAPTEPTPTAPTDITTTWTTALIEASGVVLGWAILSILLCLVSMLKGELPRLGQNLHIAIWASLPLGFMAGLQLLYYAAGGPVGKPGVSGLLAEWRNYAAFPHLVQSLALSLAIHATLFWLWSLILVYIGARQTLRGRWWSALLVMVMWTVVTVFAPVATGAIAAPETTPPIPDLSVSPGASVPDVNNLTPGSETNIQQAPPAVQTAAAQTQFFPSEATPAPDANSPTAAVSGDTLATTPEPNLSSPTAP